MPGRASTTTPAAAALTGVPEGAATSQVNAVIERWVRDTPEQWLWLHNRWPD